MWQTRWARHRSACPPLSILGEICSLPKYENIDFILGKQGIKVPSSHFCRLCQDIPGKQCIGAPRCACGHFTIPASNACVYIHTGENSVFLAQQHPKPFNNFSAIYESDCVEIWLRTVPALFDIYEERHRRIFLRLCLWKLCISLCSPRFHSSAVEWLLPVLSLRCPEVQGSSDCRLQCPESCRSRKPTA